MRIVYFILFSSFLLYSCRNGTNGDLMEILVDIGKNSPLLLTEITEEFTAIELELTEESMINPDLIRKVLLCDSFVFVLDEQMLVFDRKGKFIRSIGSKGQGPGEYIFIQSFTFDEKNKIIYIINNRSQIIGYDLNGNFIKELSMKNLNGGRGGQILSIECFNNELLLFVESIIEKQDNKNEKLLCYHSVLYKINNEMQFMDSCSIRDDNFEITFSKGRLDEYLMCNKSDIYLYYPELNSFYINFTPQLSQRLGTIKRVLQDTLYRFENNQLIPELKLKFKRNGRDYNGDKNVQLHKIYRSLRYIFAVYSTALDRESKFLFCYDTETGISYNALKYKDDFNNIEELVEGRPYRPIRPMSNNTELFYYWRTHIKPDDLAEPNPTLYIGKLKK